MSRFSEQNRGTLSVGARLRRWMCLVLPVVMIATASPSWAANEKDVDFDWIARNLDKLIKALAPSFPITFAGTDGDGNGINEDDTLAMFGAVLRGNVAPRNRVISVDATEQANMRTDFVNNRASADDHMRATGFLNLNCTLLRAVLTDIPDCRLSSVLKSTQTLGADVGGLVADLLLDLISGLLTSGDYNNNDTTGTLGYVNTVIAGAIQAAADALGQGGIAGTLIPDFKISNSEFSGNYERWGLNPRPTPSRRNAFGAAGNLDNLVDATTNLAEYTAASSVRETWLNTNGIGVYPTGITNDQPIRLTTQPASGVYAAGTNISFPMSFTGGGNASPYTYLWEDARDFGDKDSPIAASNYGITPLTDTGSYSGTATTTLTITNLTYATHDNMRPWLRISDQVTVYNTLPRGGGAPAGSAAADGLGGRATAYGQVKVVEALADGTSRGPVSLCSGPITFNAYASNGDDSGDVDTDSDPPTYLWYKGATPGTLATTGITTNTLSIANVTAGDAGYYACDVSHYFNTGSTTTRTNLVQLVFPSVPTAPSTPDLTAGTDTGSSNTDNITKNNAPTFTGSGAVPGDTITLRVDGNPNTSTTVDGSGNWSVTASTLADGARTITAIATNCAGAGTASGGLVVTIDTVAPAAPSAPDLQAASDSGTSNSDDITNVTTPNLSGTAPAGTTVAVTSSLNGLIGSSSGPNYAIASAALSNGVHNVVATATDVAGNTSVNSSTLSLTIDTVAPAAPSIPDLAAGSDSGTSSTDNITNVTTPVFNGTAESGAIVRVFSSISGQIATSAGPNYSATTSVLSNNVHSIFANATDAAGNTSVSSSGLSVTIDTVGPAAPSVPDLMPGSDSGSSNTDNLTNITTPGFSGTSEAGSVVTLLVDGNPSGTQSAPAGTYSALVPSSSLTNGVRNISARATDAAGNVGGTSAALAVTIDITAPAAPGLPDLQAVSDTGQSSSDDITNDNTPDLTGSAEANSLVTVSSSLAGVLGTPTATGGGVWTLTPGLAEGVHSITATARDAAGNTSVASSALSLTIDTTAPAAPGAPDLTAATDTGSSNSDNLTNDTTPDFTGTVIAGNSVNLNSSIAGAIGTAVVPSGSYTVTSSALANGVHNITATQTDVAGNTGASSAGLSVTIDTVAPVVSTETPNRGGTIASLPSISVTFSKSISGLVAGDLTVNGSPATNLAGTGPFVFSGYTPPTDGVVSIILSGGSVTGDAGNAFAGDTWSYTQNSAIPTVTITSGAVANGGYATTTPISMLATFSEPVTGLLGSEITVSNATLTMTPLPPLPAQNYILSLAITGQGPVSVTIPASVAQSNVAPFSDNAASNTYSFTYDTVAPTVTVNSQITNQIRPALSGTVDDLTATISITVASQTVAGVNNGDGTWSLAANILTALADNTYDVVVTATDAAANAGTDGTTTDLIIDATPPVVTVDPLTTADSTPELTGSVDDLLASISVQVGAQTVAATNNGDGSWTLADDTLTALLDNTYNVIVTATDSLSNSAQDGTSGELVIDTTPPVIGVDDLLTSDTTPALSGTVDDVAATISIQIGVQTVAATNNGNGTWTLADNTLTALADGNYNVVATATDALLNAAVDSDANELTIDTLGPVITLNGSALVEVNCGDGYSDPGASALDNRQGDTTGDIVVSGDTVTAFSLPGDYQITYNVSDSLGNAGAPVVRDVTVLANCPLSVTANSVNVTKTEGDTHTFSVTVSGAIGGLTYQWQKEDGAKAWQDIVGEDSDSYTIPVLALTDTAEYRCEVSDAVTTAYSGTIQLTVQALAGVPAAGLVGLSFAAIATALAGATALRRKR